MILRMLVLVLGVTLSATAAPKTVRLLTVGNSFAENALEFLPQIVEAAGHELVVGRANLGGCTLERHWRHAAAREADAGDPEGSPYRGGKFSLQGLLTKEPWDFVTIQQVSFKSHDPATYQPFADRLHAYIRRHAPQARIMAHQIWAYRVDDPRFIPANEGQEPHTQQVMYEQVRKAYHDLARQLKIGIVPSGDAMYLADTNEEWGYRPDAEFDFASAQAPKLPRQTHSLHRGWYWRKEKDGTRRLRIDGHHASRAGEYLIGCVWFETFFGESVVENGFVPKGMDSKYARFLRETAHRAVEDLKPKPRPVGAPGKVYFETARAYADAMLKLGRDHYGERHSPSFVDTINLRTMRMPSQTSDPTRKIYAGLFRAADSSTGCNPMYHIDLHQLLNHLSDATGNPDYRQAARDSIEWFFQNTQSPVTGFVAWGEHLAWDLVVDRVTLGSVRNGEFQLSDIHEFYGPWIHWDSTCELAPEAARRFARGLWEHQIYDQETCDFSRHASYSKHGPRKGYEFARQIGFYLDTWASVYAATGDEELLVPIRQFLKALRRWQHPDTGLIRFEGKSPQVAFILHNLALAVDGWEASTKLPDPLKSELQEFIRSLDRAVLRLKFDLTPGGQGFPKIADTATGRVTNEGMRQARPGYPMAFINQRYAPYGGLWASVYGAGSYTDARHALLCAYRLRQGADPRYRELVLATADRFLDSKPSAPGDLTPKTIAPVMALLHAAWHLSREDKYLRDSRRLADLSLQLFFEPGIPLPYSSERRADHHYYTSVSYGDSLMLMFFELGRLLDGQSVPSNLQCSIR